VRASLPGYLEALREITARAGALLIFDEVMTASAWRSAERRGVTGYGRT